MDRILWLDGHTSKISSEEAWNKQYTKDNNWFMNHADSTFVWIANCWMEV